MKFNNKYFRWSLIVAGIILGIIIVSKTTLVFTIKQFPSSQSTSELFADGKGGYGGGIAMVEEAEFMAIAPRGISMPTPTAGETAADVDQKIIKTGSLEIIVNNVHESTKSITSLASEKKGFVEHSSVSEGKDGTHFGNITIRVPSQEFETTTEKIKQLANIVENETISGQDITEQYTDLKARLRNAQAQEQTYLTILDKAKTVEDILNIQRELGNIRTQIESIQGRIQYLENKTSYATINVYLSEEPSISIPSKEFRPLSSVKEAAKALVTAGQNIIIGLIWFVITGGGILIPLGIIIWVIVKIIQKTIRRRKKQIMR